MPKLEKKQGSVAILISVIILSGMMIITLAISTLITRQISLSVISGESVIAYQAADSGIELSFYTLNEDNATTTVLFLSSIGISSNQVCSGASPNWFPVGTASFCLDTFEDGTGHLTGIKSIGKYKNIRRAIKIGSSP